MSLVERSYILFPFLGGSTIGGFTVYEAVTSVAVRGVVCKKLNQRSHADTLNGQKSRQNEGYNALSRFR